MRPLVAAGVLAVAVGFLAVADRGVAAAIDVSAAVVTLIGVLGIAQGVRYASARRGHRRPAADPGDPERRAPAAVPGADADERIARALDRRGRGHRDRSAIRDRVREVAVAAVARDRSCSREAAAAAVDGGTWTDDRTAAAFLDAGAAYPLSVRIRSGIAGESRYRRGLRAAIGEVDRIESGGDP